MSGIPETIRFDVNLSTIAQVLIDEMKVQGWLGTYLIYNRAIGSGQLEAPIEKELIAMGLNPKHYVYGCEMHQMDVQYAIHDHDLKGTYKHTGDYMNKPKFDDISFAPGERDFKYIEIGNYPYNDGSVNNNVIWNKFIADAKASWADAVGVVVQASFLSQQFKGMSKSVKKDLIALGCYKIVVNDYSDFDEAKAKVKTCIIFCRRGYQGLVEFVERKTGHSVKSILNEPFDMIFDPEHRKFLDEVKLARRTSFKRMPQYKIAKNKNQWHVGCYYKTEGFDKNPLKPFIVIEPNSPANKNFYVSFGSAETEDDAKLLMEQLQSFWFNDAVQAILLLTRYQISLDATQYAKVPFTLIDRVFGEDELFDLWNISEESRVIARALVKECNHKKVKEIEDATNN